MKIKNKLITLPILMSTAVILAIILFALFNYQKALLAELNANQVQQVNGMAQTLDEYILKYKDTMTHLQSLDIVNDFDEYDQIDVEFRGIPDYKGAALRNLFKNTMRTYPNFSSMVMMRVSDALIAVYEPYEDQLKVPKDTYLEGFAYRDWYRGVMATEATYISEAFTNATIQEPVVAIATPIFEEGTIVGVLIGNLRLSSLSDKVQSLGYGDTGITYIIDQNNHVIVHPDKSHFAEGTLHSLSESKIVQYIHNNTADKEGSIKIYDDISDSDVYMFYKKADSGDWIIISQIEVSEVEAPLQEMILIIVIFSVPLLGLYFLFMYINAKSILTMLSFLNGISKEVIRMDMTLSDKEEKSFLEYEQFNNEIGVLMTTYHSMIRSLKNSFTLLETSNKEVKFLADHDPLTSLPNRRHFHKVLTEQLEQGKHGAVVLMDIDNFKLINDTLGHLYGDKVLQGVSDKLSTMCSSHIFISRFGGDEFILCVDGIKSKDDIIELIEELKDLFAETMVIDEITIEVSFSIGISQYPSDSNDLTQLIRFSDLALYEAKGSGKNHHEFFNGELEKVVFYKSAIEKELKEALLHDGLKLVFQPQVNLKSGQVDAYEALLRLKNTFYTPGEFIPISEETGQIIDIGRWVLHETIRQVGQWRAKGLTIKPVSVNFSVAQLHDNDFLAYLTSLLDTYNLPPSYIEIELTENIFITKVASTLKFLMDLNTIGVKISIDDFGTGYSSLNYLISLPVQKIKLDRSLSEEFLAPEKVETIHSLIALIHSLGMTIVAEGIESKEDVRRLREAGCDYIQGYYFSRPMDVADTENDLLKDYCDKIEI